MDCNGGGDGAGDVDEWEDDSVGDDGDSDGKKEGDGGADNDDGNCNGDGNDDDNFDGNCNGDGVVVVVDGDDKTSCDDTVKLWDER